MKAADRARALARIEYLKVRNFRALRDVEFKNMTPLTVLLGPNGSGKSTVFDVFAFLAECFEMGLRRAWDKRGRAKELRSRGAEGPVSIELKYREHGFPLITYHLAIDDHARCRHHPVFHDLRQIFDLAQGNGDAFFGGDFLDQFDRVAAVGAAGAEHLDVFHAFSP